MWPCYGNELSWVSYLYLSITSVLSFSSLSCGSGVHILERPYVIINKMKVSKFQMNISYHTKWRMKNDGRDPLWINLDKSWNVKYVNSHVTACFSTVKKRCFSFLLGYTFYYVFAWKSLTMIFKFSGKNKTFVCRCYKTTCLLCNINFKHKTKSYEEIWYRKLCMGENSRHSTKHCCFGQNNVLYFNVKFYIFKNSN